MDQTPYVNGTYWKSLHESFAGSLRSVGWPGLSESYNRLKYESETVAFTQALNLAASKQKNVKFLEVGVGIGFWTGITYAFARHRDIHLDLTALDISAEALGLVKELYPDADCREIDLTTVDHAGAVPAYNVVSAIMVLLHLTDVETYQNALKFCARSVRDGGALIVYEPLLIRNYSPFLSKKHSGFLGNSYAHPKIYLDNIMYNLGFSEEAAFPGASWMLNAPIQAGSRMGYELKNLVWLALYGLVYKSDRFSRGLSAPLLALDAIAKKRGGDSGTFVVYRKLRAC